MIIMIIILNELPFSKSSSLLLLLLLLLPLPPHFQSSAGFSQLASALFLLCPLGHQLLLPLLGLQQLELVLQADSRRSSVDHTWWQHIA
jgi:hypothetical protein